MRHAYVFGKEAKLPLSHCRARCGGFSQHCRHVGNAGLTAAPADDEAMGSVRGRPERTVGPAKRTAAEGSTAAVYRDRDRNGLLPLQNVSNRSCHGSESRLLNVRQPLFFAPVPRGDRSDVRPQSSTRGPRLVLQPIQRLAWA